MSLTSLARRPARRCAMVQRSGRASGCHRETQLPQFARTMSRSASGTIRLEKRYGSYDCRLPRPL